MAAAAISLNPIIFEWARDGGRGRRGEKWRFCSPFFNLHSSQCRCSLKSGTSLQTKLICDRPEHVHSIVQRVVPLV